MLAPRLTLPRPSLALASLLDRLCHSKPYMCQYMLRAGSLTLRLPRCMQREFVRLDVRLLSDGHITAHCWCVTGTLWHCRIETQNCSTRPGIRCAVDFNKWRQATCSRQKQHLFLLLVKSVTAMLLLTPKAQPNLRFLGYVNGNRESPGLPKEF